MVSTRLLHVATLVIAGGLSTHATTQTAAPETAVDLAANGYRTLRGINFLATYPSLVQTPPFPGFNGIASSSAMWHYYGDTSSGTDTRVHVDEQLDFAVKMGINTVRVFLSFPAWRFYDRSGAPSNHLIDSFTDFLGRCESRGVFCIPVIWDGLEITEGLSPYYGTNSDCINTSADFSVTTDCFERNFWGWHSNPGDELVECMVAVGPCVPGTPPLTAPAFDSTPLSHGADAMAYLDEIITAADSSSAFLMWEVMNEPGVIERPDPAPPESLPLEHFNEATIQYIKSHQIGSSQLVMLEYVGYSVGGTFGQSMADSNPPLVDALAIHPYGNTRSVTEAFVLDAVTKPDGTFRSIPVIATETGSPGTGAAYQDSLNYATKVPRPDVTSQPATGVGFMSWVLQVGQAGGRFPFKETSGIYYSTAPGAATPGVRERDVIQTFYDIACDQLTDQTLSTGHLFTQAEIDALSEVALGDPRFVAQGPVPIELDSWSEIEGEIAQAFTNPGHFLMYDDLDSHVEYITILQEHHKWLYTGVRWLPNNDVLITVQGLNFVRDIAESVYAAPHKHMFPAVAPLTENYRGSRTYRSDPVQGELTISSWDDYYHLTFVPSVHNFVMANPTLFNEWEVRSVLGFPAWLNEMALVLAVLGGPYP